MKVGIIGYGAIGSALHRGLAAAGHDLVGVLLRRASPSAAKDGLRGLAITSTVEELLDLRPEAVVECAGHAALRLHGKAILIAGIDLVVSSIGALAEHELESELWDAAQHGGRLVLPSGALGGLDALGAARLAGLDEVRYTSRKAPRAWIGTAAERMIDLSGVSTARVFFEGSAREAALNFPQNANVAAAVALAGIGFDRTAVRLMVDPVTKGNQHLIEARGPFGEISAAVSAQTFPDNPKTSMLTPYSIVKTLSNLSSPMLI